MGVPQWHKAAQDDFHCVLQTFGRCPGSEEAEKGLEDGGGVQLEVDVRERGADDGEGGREEAVGVLEGPAARGEEFEESSAEGELKGWGGVQRGGEREGILAGLETCQVREEAGRVPMQQPEGHDVRSAELPRDGMCLRGRRGQLRKLQRDLGLEEIWSNQDKIEKSKKFRRKRLT